MISAAIYWKNRLKSQAALLEKYYNLASWTDEANFHLEEAVFTGFFTIRKLIECKLTEPVVSSMKVNCMRYKKAEGETAEALTQLSSQYDFGNGESVEMTIREIANQFIHSYHFLIFKPTNKDIVGFNFASDKKHGDQIYYLTLANLVGIFESVATGRPAKFGVFTSESGGYSLYQMQVS